MMLEDIENEISKTLPQTVSALTPTQITVFSSAPNLSNSELEALTKRAHKIGTILTAIAEFERLFPQKDDVSTLAFSVIAKLHSLGMPTYYCSRDILKTQIPNNEIRWDSLQLKHDAALILIPEKVLCSPDGNQIDFFAYSRSQPGELYSLPFLDLRASPVYEETNSRFTVFTYDPIDMASYAQNILANKSPFIYDLPTQLYNEVKGESGSILYGIGPSGEQIEASETEQLWLTRITTLAFRCCYYFHLNATHE